MPTRKSLRVLRGPETSGAMNRDSHVQLQARNSLRRSSETALALAHPAIAFAVAAEWQLSDEECAVILGYPASVAENWQHGLPIPIDFDTIARGTYLIGVHRAIGRRKSPANLCVGSSTCVAIQVRGSYRSSRLDISKAPNGYTATFGTCPCSCIKLCHFVNPWCSRHGKCQAESQDRSASLIAALDRRHSARPNAHEPRRTTQCTTMVSGRGC